MQFYLFNLFYNLTAQLNKIVWINNGKNITKWLPSVYFTLEQKVNNKANKFNNHTHTHTHIHTHIHILYTHTHMHTVLMYFSESPPTSFYKYSNNLNSINTGKRTERSPVWLVIIQVITNHRSPICYHEYDYRPTSDNTKSTYQFIKITIFEKHKN